MEVEQGAAAAEGLSMGMRSSDTSSPPWGAVAAGKSEAAAGAGGGATAVAAAGATHAAAPTAAAVEAAVAVVSDAANTAAVAARAAEVTPPSNGDAAAAVPPPIGDTAWRATAAARPAAAAAEAVVTAGGTADGPREREMVAVAAAAEASAACSPPWRWRPTRRAEQSSGLRSRVLLAAHSCRTPPPPSHSAHVEATDQWGQMDRGRCSITPGRNAWPPRAPPRRARKVDNWERLPLAPTRPPAPPRGPRRPRRHLQRRPHRMARPPAPIQRPGVADWDALRGPLGSGGTLPKRRMTNSRWYDLAANGARREPQHAKGGRARRPLPRAARAAATTPPRPGRRRTRKWPTTTMTHSTVTSTTMTWAATTGTTRRSGVRRMTKTPRLRRIKSSGKSYRRKRRSSEHCVSGGARSTGRCGPPCSGSRRRRTCGAARSPPPSYRGCCSGRSKRSGRQMQEWPKRSPSCTRWIASTRSNVRALKPTWRRSGANSAIVGASSARPKPTWGRRACTHGRGRATVTTELVAARSRLHAKSSHHPLTAYSGKLARSWRQWRKRLNQAEAQTSSNSNCTPLWPASGICAEPCNNRWPHQPSTGEATTTSPMTTPSFQNSTKRTGGGTAAAGDMVDGDTSTTATTTTTQPTPTVVDPSGTTGIHTGTDRPTGGGKLVLGCPKRG